MERKINEKERTHILDGISAVLFDLDGTLVDSMWMWEAIDIEYLGRFGLNARLICKKAIEGMGVFQKQQYILKNVSNCQTLLKRLNRRGWKCLWKNTRRKYL